MENPSLISSLLSERSNFIVIGLTGRTGSGCSTASKLLTDNNLQFPREGEVHYESKPYFTGLDKKRYWIVRNFAQNSHAPFFLIKISDFITTRLLQIETDEFEELLKFIVEEHYQAKIPESRILEAFKQLQDNLNEDPDLANFKEYLCNDQEADQELKIDKWQNFIGKATETIKNILKVDLGNCYVKLYQHIGDSIRKTALIKTNYRQLPFETEGLHILPQMIRVC